MATTTAATRPVLVAIAAAQPAPSPDEHREIVGRCHVLLRRAILTIAAIPDAERRFQSGPKSSMPRPQPDPNVSYDSEAAQAELARAGRFRPNRKDLARYMTVLGWLNWLKRQGEHGELGVRLIISRAYDNSWWQVAQRLRLGKSDDTARRWHHAAVEAIAINFAAEISSREME